MAGAGKCRHCCVVEQHTALTKSDRYCRVGMPVKQQPCFLKLYLAKSRWQQLGFRLGVCRAIRAFDAARELRRGDYRCPRRGACLRVPEGVLLLTEGIANSQDLRALWLEQPAAEYAGQLMQCAGAALPPCTVPASPTVIANGATCCGMARFVTW